MLPVLSFDLYRIVHIQHVELHLCPVFRHSWGLCEESLVWHQKHLARLHEAANQAPFWT